MITVPIVYQHPLTKEVHVEDMVVRNLEPHFPIVARGKIPLRIGDPLSDKATVYQVNVFRETMFFVLEENQRKVEVDIYIDSEFMRGPDRMKKLEEWTIKRAPWFFSYAKRGGVVKCYMCWKPKTECECSK
ncbi:MAG: hypothetical protein ACRCV5_21730 [Afipia sp.]